MRQISTKSHLTLRSVFRLHEGDPCPTKDTPVLAGVDVAKKSCSLLDT